MHQGPPHRPLTPSEIRLLQTSVDNHTDSDKALAALLFISKHTVHTHFKNIMDVLQVHTRFGAITRAIELGLVAPCGPWVRKIPQSGYGRPPIPLLLLDQPNAREVNKMAMKVTYTVINGEILSENRGGVKRDYVADPSGSVVALLDNNQAQTDTFSYWPFLRHEVA